MCVLNCNDRSCSELGVVFATETYDSTFRLQPASATLVKLKKKIGSQQKQISHFLWLPILSVLHVISGNFLICPDFKPMGPTSFGGGLGYDEPPGRLKAALLQPQVERRMASTHGMNNTFATSKHMCIKCETKSSRQMMNVSSSTLCLGGGNSQIFFGIFTPNVWGFMIQFDGCIFFSTGF